MRIGLIYHQFVPRGGLEGYLLEFAKRLQAAGHDLHIVTAEIAPELQRALDATVHRIPLVRGSQLLRMWQFDRVASRMVKDLPVDVSIGFGRTTTHDLHRAGGGCHAVYSRLLPLWKRWSPKNRLELDLEKKLYTSGRTKLFVVNSAQVARQLHAAYGTDEKLFRVIHTAVDTDKFKPLPQRAALREGICEKLKTDPARQACLFVSLSHRRKGLDVLLDVWKDVDADLWIVGKTLNYRYRLKIAKHGLQNRVRAISPTSDMALLYQAADWFVHPTLYDACANTVLQSMASGLPGLISADDGVTDLLRDGENGFLLPRPRDPASVLSVLKKALAMDEHARVAMGRSARETVLPLTWEAHLTKWLAAIDEVGRDIA